MASDAIVSKNTKAVDDLRRSLDKFTRALENHTHVLAEISKKGKDEVKFVQVVNGVDPKRVAKSIGQSIEEIRQGGTGV